jgi:3-oxoacyl-[acyl-carrier protein] reductase
MDSRVMHARQIEEIRVGDEAVVSHRLTEEDVRAFAALTGDQNPLHLDEEFARTTTYGRPVVHGMLSASFISTLIGMVLPGRGALWVSQTLEFLRPAYVGDTLRVAARVLQKSQATRMLTLDVAVTNQRGEKILGGTSIVKLLECRRENGVNSATRDTVLITGGSGDIGTAVARRLAEDGHAVIVNYARSRDRAERVVAEVLGREGRAMSVQADVGRWEDVEALFAAAQEKFGPVTGIVHCAASGSALQPFAELQWQTVQAQLEVQVKGAFNCMKAALPQMVAAGSGAIVLIGSIASDGVPPALQADYVVAKSALSALGRCVAAEYGPKGVRVNVVAPGMTQTGMIANLPEKAKMLGKMQAALRRLAEPVDIANVVSFLLSPAARHITGETVRVCGGAVMQ